MTKSKRFVMKDPNAWGYPITDTDTGKVYSCASNSWMKELCTDINKIVDEKEQLKLQYSELEITLMNNQLAYNDLEKENKELKAKVDDKEVAVEVETCKVMEKIFDLIDKKIKEADEGFEQTYDSWYQGQIDALKELKKELQ